ncbi:MAG: hypothetical protein AMXMBFR34_14470 [Myxococcaceae bacterium]
MGHLLRAALVGAVFGLAAQGCFDPLYESGQPLADTWVVCCEGSVLGTCLCEDTATCQQAFVACAGGSCNRGASCGVGGGAGGGGGAAGGGTGGASGGGSGDGGTAGGAGGGGGFLDAGLGGGAGGGTGGGGPLRYEPCCVSGLVTSCQCPASGCTGVSFKPCSAGRCVPSGASCT